MSVTEKRSYSHSQMTVITSFKPEKTTVTVENTRTLCPACHTDHMFGVKDGVGGI